MITRKHKPDRGFMIIDAIVALGLIAAIAFTLIVTKAGVARLNNALADRRAATRTAERYLIEENAGDLTNADLNIHVTDLDTAAPAGFRWVWVDVTINGRHSGLAGLLRRKS